MENLLVDFPFFFAKYPLCYVANVPFGAELNLQKKHQKKVEKLKTIL